MVGLDDADVLRAVSFLILKIGLKDEGTSHGKLEEVDEVRKSDDGENMEEDIEMVVAVLVISVGCICC